MLVREIMTRPVVTVTPETPLRVAAALLTGRGFTALPVVDGHRLVGIVTEADVLRDTVRHDPRSPQAAAPATGPAPATVGDVMTIDVLSAPPDADVAALVAEMGRLGIRSVPVEEPRTGLVGIVSRRDVLETLTRADVAIATDVRRLLEIYAGPGRWSVAVRTGTVTLADRFDDPAEQHAAAVLAASVRGVVDVRVEGTGP